jgi:tetratricopeptide (TPR) repeat protein
VQSHGNNTTHHAWLWIYGSDGTIYWIDPTWTDGNGYIWWGVVQDGREVQTRPAERLCAVRLPNNAAFASFNSGNANKNEGRYDQARADYEETLRLDPNNALAYNNRGFAYANKRDYDRAIADYEVALRIDPNYSNARTSLENARRARGY